MNSKSRGKNVCCSKSLLYSFSSMLKILVHYNASQIRQASNNYKTVTKPFKKTSMIVMEISLLRSIISEISTHLLEKICNNPKILLISLKNENNQLAREDFNFS